LVIVDVFLLAGLFFTAFGLFGFFCGLMGERLPGWG